MKRFTIILAICAAVLHQTSAVATAGKDPKKKGGKPDSFPTVALAAASAPRYTVLAMDPWREKIAYVLFDGSLANGYGRIYVWIPNDIKYAKPVPFNTVDGRNFAPFSMDSRHADEKSSVTWRLGWLKRTSGGGTYKRYNYATGETKVTQRKAATYSVFTFSATYQRGPAVGSTTWPLDITASGELNAPADWKKLPGALSPWYGLTISMTPKPVHEKGQINFQGKLLYTYRWPCVVRSLPDDAQITLLVSPFREPPVYSNVLTAAEALGGKVAVNLPYGWYNFQWGMSCRGLNVRPWHERRIYPYPFTKPPGMK